jgi:membrane-bound metal-dependent hydrolase YbcI (DUF457 family)
MTYKTHISFALAIATLPLTILYNNIKIIKNENNITKNIEDFYIFSNNEFVNGFFQSWFGLFDFYGILNIISKINNAENIFIIISLLLSLFIIGIGSLLPDIDHDSSKITKNIENKLNNFFFVLSFFLIVIIVFWKHVLIILIGIEKNLSIDIINKIEWFNNIVIMIEKYSYVMNFLITFLIIVLLFYSLLKLGSFFNHREETHSLVYNVLFSLVIVAFASFFLNKIFLVPFLLLLIGSILHLVGDGLTVSGVPFFKPFSNKKYGLLPKKIRFHTNGIIELRYVLPISIGVITFNIYSLINSIHILK